MARLTGSWKTLLPLALLGGQGFAQSCLDAINDGQVDACVCNELEYVVSYVAYVALSTSLTSNCEALPTSTLKISTSSYTSVSDPSGNSSSDAYGNGGTYTDRGSFAQATAGGNFLPRRQLPSGASSFDFRLPYYTITRSGTASATPITVSSFNNYTSLFTSNPISTAQTLVVSTPTAAASDDRSLARGTIWVAIPDGRIDYPPPVTSTVYWSGNGSLSAPSTISTIPPKAETYIVAINRPADASAQSDVPAQSDTPSQSDPLPQSNVPQSNIPQSNSPQSDAPAQSNAPQSNVPQTDAPAQSNAPTPSDVTFPQSYYPAQSDSPLPQSNAPAPNDPRPFVTSVVQYSGSASVNGPTTVSIISPDGDQAGTVVVAVPPIASAGGGSPPSFITSVVPNQSPSEPGPGGDGVSQPLFNIGTEGLVASQVTTEIEYTNSLAATVTVTRTLDAFVATPSGTQPGTVFVIQAPSNAANPGAGSTAGTGPDGQPLEASFAPGSGATANTNPGSPAASNDPARGPAGTGAPGSNATGGSGPGQNPGQSGLPPSGPQASPAATPGGSSPGGPGDVVQPGLYVTSEIQYTGTLQLPGRVTISSIAPQGTAQGTIIVAVPPGQASAGGSAGPSNGALPNNQSPAGQPNNADPTAFFNTLAAPGATGTGNAGSGASAPVNGGTPGAPVATDPATGQPLTNPDVLSAAAYITSTVMSAGLSVPRTTIATIAPQDSRPGVFVVAVPNNPVSSGGSAVPQSNAPGAQAPGQTVLPQTFQPQGAASSAGAQSNVPGAQSNVPGAQSNVPGAQSNVPGAQSNVLGTQAPGVTVQPQSIQPQGAASSAAQGSGPGQAASQGGVNPGATAATPGANTVPGAGDPLAQGIVTVTSTVLFTGPGQITAPTAISTIPANGNSPPTVIQAIPDLFVTVTITVTAADPTLQPTAFSTVQPTGNTPGTVLVAAPASFVTSRVLFTGPDSISAATPISTILPQGTTPGTIILAQPFVSVTSTRPGSTAGTGPAGTVTVVTTIFPSNGPATVVFAEPDPTAPLFGSFVTSVVSAASNIASFALVPVSTVLPQGSVPGTIVLGQSAAQTQPAPASSGGASPANTPAGAGTSPTALANSNASGQSSPAAGVSQAVSSPAGAATSPPALANAIASGQSSPAAAASQAVPSSSAPGIPNTGAQVASPGASAASSQVPLDNSLGVTGPTTLATATVDPNDPNGTRGGRGLVTRLITSAGVTGSTTVSTIVPTDPLLAITVVVIVPALQQPAATAPATSIDPNDPNGTRGGRGLVTRLITSAGVTGSTTVSTIVPTDPLLAITVVVIVPALQQPAATTPAISSANTGVQGASQTSPAPAQSATSVPAAVSSLLVDPAILSSASSVLGQSFVPTPSNSSLPQSSAVPSPAAQSSSAGQSNVQQPSTTPAASLSASQPISSSVGGTQIGSSNAASIAPSSDPALGQSFVSSAGVGTSSVDPAASSVASAGPGTFVASTPGSGVTGILVRSTSLRRAFVKRFLVRGYWLCFVFGLSPNLDSSSHRLLVNIPDYFRQLNLLDYSSSDFE
ncbi:hypothetical protein Brms1b_003525 [Colletotrichum noveboracense]|nr:hypothetical protein Brms1b_003525 [Colletotrichum noveboracense]